LKNLFLENKHKDERCIYSQNNFPKGINLAETIVQLYLKLVQMVVITLILVLLIYRKRQYKINALYWLITIFALAELQGLTEILIFMYKVYFLKLPEPSLFRFNELHSIPYSLALFALYLMGEYMSRLRPNPQRLITVSSMWGAYFGLLMYDSFHGFNWNFTPENLVLDSPQYLHEFNTWFNVYQFTIMAFVTLIFWQSYRTSYSEANKRVSLLMFIGVLIYTVVAFEELVESLISFTGTGLLSYKAIYYSITFLVLAYVFVKYPYYVFNVPTYVYRIVLSTREGVFIYGAQIELPFFKNADEASDELLASAISALTQFMEEAADSKGTLRLVELEDRALLVRKEKSLMGMVISQSATRMLSSALGQFVREFNQKFKVSFDNAWDSDSFAGAESIIARCFPFVEAKDIIQTKLKTWKA